MSRNKKRIIVALVLVPFALILLLIASFYRWPSEGKYQGIFIPRFEDMAFHPDWSFESWWLKEQENTYDFGEFKGELGKIFADMAQRDCNTAIETPCYRIKVQGKLSPMGKYGHMGMSRRELTVEKLIEYEYVGNSRY